MAGARRLLLLRNALLLGIGPAAGCRHAGRWRAGVDDRPAEIAGQRRAELRRGARQTRIVARQVGEAVRGRAIAGVVEFGAGGLLLRLQGEEQRAADADRRDGAKAEQHLAREPRHRRPARIAAASPAAADRRSDRPRRLFVRGVGHDCGLPSVRTMRTFCLVLAAETELGRGEQPIDDHVVALDAVVDELGRRLPAPITQSGGISPWPMPLGNSMNTCRPSSKARSGRQAGVSPSMR